MRAGLLADIILGESPYLKGLARYYNFLVLDQNGKITGTNTHFLRNSRKTEDQVINQNFAKFFDSDEGKVELQYSVKQAFKGTPTVVSFSLTESKVHFKGVILPVYDKGHTPASIIIIAKEEFRTVIAETELDDFWKVAQNMIAEAGIGPALEAEPPKTLMKKSKILLIEDQNGLISKVFKNQIQKPKDHIRIVSDFDAALKEISGFNPNVLISTFDPAVNADDAATIQLLKTKTEASIICLTSVGNELRIEDGWLDIHVKNQADSATKILDLIDQLYW